ncbi:MAG: S8 family serine peptidase [bacterium]
MNGTRVRLVFVLSLLLALSACAERTLAPDSTDGPGRDVRTHEIGGQYVEPGPPTLPSSVPNQLVAEVADGWTAELIADTWNMSVLDSIEGTSFALMYYDPSQYSYSYLAQVLISTGACVTCNRNFRLEVPEAQQGSIAFYEGNLVRSDLEDQEALARIHAPEAQAVEDGSGVVVAIVDTGIDGTHPDLGPRLTAGWDFVDNDADATDETDGIDQDGDSLVDEAAGHGTHVAGIVQSVAPGVTLMPVRVLDTEGRGTAFNVARGIHWARLHGADVINLSLGFDGFSRPIEHVIESARAAGVTVTAAAGNAGQFTMNHFPALLPEVLAVASVDPVDLKSSFSNFGLNIDLGAPGEGIVSTYLFQGYAVWSGTSMATPFVSGAAAIAIEAGATSPGSVRGALLNAAAPYAHDGLYYEGLLGAGRLDLLPLVAP